MEHCDCEHAPSAQGSFELYDSETTTVISLRGLKKDNFVTTIPKKYWLNLAGRAKRGTLWCKKKHIIVTEQLPIKFTTSESEGHQIEQSTKAKACVVDENASHITISTSTHEFIFDKKNGSVGFRLSDSSKKTIFMALSPNFTRADTDNDRGGKEIVRSFFDYPIIIDFAFWKCQVEKMLNLNTGLVDLNRSFSTCWHEKGLSASDPPKMKCEHFGILEDDEDYRISIEAKTLALSARNIVLMTVDSRFQVCDDVLDVSYSVRPSQFLHNLLSLPRIGFTFLLGPEYYHVSYFGRGGHENYPDRKASAQFGVWNSSPAEMHANYIVPGENGNRCDCRWVSFLNISGEGLLIVSKEDAGFCFSASLWSQEELHNATHTHDLESRCNGNSDVHVNIDHALMGAGGDVGWNPCVYEQYRVRAESSYRCRYVIMMMVLPYCICYGSFKHSLPYPTSKSAYLLSLYHPVMSQP